MKKCFKIFSLLAALGCGATSPKIAASRDPFYLEEKKELKKIDFKKTKIHQRSNQILLEGIMAVGDRLAAVLNDGNESNVVAIGDHIGEYLVKQIDCNVVVLIHGKKTKKLELD